MNTTITVRISDDMKKDLENLIKAEDRAISDLIRDSLKNYIVVQKFRKLKNTVLPFAEAQGIITDDDIFKIVS